MSTNLIPPNITRQPTNTAPATDNQQCCSRNVKAGASAACLVGTTVADVAIAASTNGSSLALGLGIGCACGIAAAPFGAIVGRVVDGCKKNAPPEAQPMV